LCLVSQLRTRIGSLRRVCSTTVSSVLFAAAAYALQEAEVSVNEQPCAVAAA